MGAAGPLALAACRLPLAACRLPLAVGTAANDSGFAGQQPDRRRSNEISTRARINIGSPIFQSAKRRCKGDACRAWTVIVQSFFKPDSNTLPILHHYTNAILSTPFMHRQPACPAAESNRPTANIGHPSHKKPWARLLPRETKKPTEAAHFFPRPTSRGRRTNAAPSKIGGTSKEIAHIFGIRQIAPQIRQPTHATLCH
jgi:hypothetical protein